MKIVLKYGIEEIDNKRAIKQKPCPSKTSAL